jgi:hypothetical protein
MPSAKQLRMCLEASFEDGIIRVCHVNHIDGDVFSVGVIGSAEGYWECDSSDGLDSFPPKP